MSSAAMLERPWFESPFFERELEAADLTPEMKALVRFYAENGYVVFDPQIEDFDRLAAAIDTELSERFSRANRVQDAWQYLPEVRQLAAHPRIKELLFALYRRRPFPFQTLNFRHGTQQATHSDLAHFDSMPSRFMAGVWIALEDVKPDSGPLHYFPGSHRLPTYLPHELGLRCSQEPFEEVYPPYEQFVHEMIEQAGLEKEIVDVKKGQILIWAANMLHGGEPIANQASTRRSQVVHFYFEGCRYWTPIRSDPPLGQIFWRRVVNVETGRVEPHKYHGQKAALPLGSRLRGAYSYRLNTPGPVGDGARAVKALGEKVIGAVRR